ncbi:MAG: metal-dependent hydrolase [Nanoarchaeota archaeon]|nr:metal-dependent hydrolase [Nanoarchaeota archaeon]
MMFKTHLALGALAGILLLKYFQPGHAVLFSLVFLFAAVLPDIDTTKSVIGRQLWPFSAILTLFVKHRGFLHTVWVPFIVFLSAYTTDYAILGSAFALGYLTHIAADSMTAEGVSFFQPVWKRHFRGFIKTGGKLEYAFLFIVCVSLGITTAAIFH